MDILIVGAVAAAVARAESMTVRGSEPPHLPLVFYGGLAKCRVRLARMWLLDNCWLPGDIPSTKMIAMTSRVQILVVTKSISTFSKCQFLLGSCVT